MGDPKGQVKGGHSRSLSKGPAMTGLSESAKDQSIVSK